MFIRIIFNGLYDEWMWKTPSAWWNRTTEWCGGVVIVRLQIGFHGDHVMLQSCSIVEKYSNIFNNSFYNHGDSILCRSLKLGISNFRRILDYFVLVVSFFFIIFSSWEQIMDERNSTTFIHTTTESWLHTIWVLKLFEKFSEFSR